MRQDTACYSIVQIANNELNKWLSNSLRRLGDCAAAGKRDLIVQTYISGLDSLLILLESVMEAKWGSLRIQRLATA